MLLSDRLTALLVDVLGLDWPNKFGKAPVDEHWLPIATSAAKIANAAITTAMLAAAKYFGIFRSPSRQNNAVAVQPMPGDKSAITLVSRSAGTIPLLANGPKALIETS